MKELQNRKEIIIKVIIMKRVANVVLLIETFIDHSKAMNFCPPHFLFNFLLFLSYR